MNVELVNITGGSGRRSEPVEATARSGNWLLQLERALLDQQPGQSGAGRDRSAIPAAAPDGEPLVRAAEMSNASATINSAATGGMAVLAQAPARTALDVSSLCYSIPHAGPVTVTEALLSSPCAADEELSDVLLAKAQPSARPFAQLAKDGQNGKSRGMPSQIRLQPQSIEYPKHHLHLYYGNAGVQACVRDANLPPMQALVIAAALTHELRQAGMTLSALTVNGRSVDMSNERPADELVASTHDGNRVGLTTLKHSVEKREN